jgi:hypothetical protein
VILPYNKLSLKKTDSLVVYLTVVAFATTSQLRRASVKLICKTWSLDTKHLSITVMERVLDIQKTHVVLVCATSSLKTSYHVTCGRSL